MKLYAAARKPKAKSGFGQLVVVCAVGMVLGTTLTTQATAQTTPAQSATDATSAESQESEKAHSELIRLTAALQGQSPATDPKGLLRAKLRTQLGLQHIALFGQAGFADALVHFNNALNGLMPPQLGQTQSDDVTLARLTTLSNIMYVSRLAGQPLSSQKAAEDSLAILGQFSDAAYVARERPLIEFGLSQALVDQAKFIQAETVIRKILTTTPLPNERLADEASLLLAHILVSTVRFSQARFVIHEGLQKSRARQPQNSDSTARWLSYASLVLPPVGADAEKLAIAQERLSLARNQIRRLDALMDAVAPALRLSQTALTDTYLTQAVEIESRLRAQGRIRAGTPQIQIQLIKLLLLAKRHSETTPLLSVIETADAQHVGNWSINRLVTTSQLAQLYQSLERHDDAYYQADKAGKLLLAGPGVSAGIDADAKRNFTILREIFLVQVQSGWHAAQRPLP